MGKAIIGDVLKKRIKEKGYTQEEFAEEVGIGHSTLKKYLSGETAYTYEQMEKFAKLLDCSYDYLLGLSKSPIKEYHEIAEQTRLSEKAIERIASQAKYYDEDFNAKRFIICLDELLCKEGVFRSICDYMMPSRHTEKIFTTLIEATQSKLREIPTTKNIDIDDDKRLTLETQNMVHMVSMLKDMKASMSQELIAEIKALDTPEFFEKEDRELEAEIKRLTES